MMPGFAFGEIQNAIVDAFERPDLVVALRTMMNVRLDVIVAAGAFGHEVFGLLRWAEMNGRELELVRVLAALRPNHPGMQEIGRKYGLSIRLAVAEAGREIPEAPTDAAGGGLEEIIRPHLAFIDSAIWRERMTEVERQVCMITLAGAAQGTGFLVGADLLLTNWHVLEPVIAGRSASSEVECVFDFKLLADLSKSRTPVGLKATGWLEDFCPCAQLELQGRAAQAAPTTDELDYALVRLADPIGARPWAAGAATGAPHRGWITIPAAPYDFKSPMGVVIAQHPAGWPLKLAIDTSAIDRARAYWLNAGGTRIRYATNTLGGSSGSPVFDFDWRPIALHHYGDAGYSHAPGFNQGIPIHLIRDRLRRNGKEALIGGGSPDA